MTYKRRLEQRLLLCVLPSSGLQGFGRTQVSNKELALSIEIFSAAENKKGPSVWTTLS